MAGAAAGAVLGGPGGAGVGATTALAATVLTEYALRLHSSRSAAGDAAREAGGVLPVPAGQHTVRGRDQIIKAVDGHAKAPDGRFHVLTGLGGVGKTAIAIEVARRARGRGQPVWWVAASDPGEAGRAMLDLAQHLGASRAEIEQIHTGERSGPDLVWRLLESRRGWMLVFDNLDEPDALGREGRPVADARGWVRPSESGLVLITSRRTDRAVWGTAAAQHHLDILEREAAVRVLHDISGVATGGADAGRLAARLGDLPLALHLAGAYLADRFTDVATFGDYLSVFDRRFGELMKAPAEASPDDPRQAITTTWEISLDSLELRGLRWSRKLLRLLSRYAPTIPIPFSLLLPEILEAEGLLPAGPDPAGRLTDGLRALHSLGLVRCHGTPIEALEVHPLVADTQRHHDQPEGVSLRLAVRLLDDPRAHNPSAPADWPYWRSVTPHISALLPQTVQDRTVFDLMIGITNTAVWGLLHGGDFRAAELMGRALAELADGRAIEGQPDLLVARHGLGMALLRGGRPMEARAELLDLLATARRTIGEDERTTLDVRHSLANISRQRGDFEAAERELNAVLDAQVRLLPTGDLSISHTRQSLGHVLTDRGELERAQEVCRTVLEERRAVLGDDHPWTLSSRHEHAKLLHRREDLPRASREYDTIVATGAEVLGAEHPSTLDWRHARALVLRDLGRRAEAVAECRAVFETRARRLGDDHPSTLSVLRSLRAMT
ncbi:tetratricopeptide repeat protein [Sphaerisporangium aureirubrum]|uniref:Tetratricopeptide repeat protein n=1 Tax=Sphaerisporangium aureirubrum TaxID=1544736 RepID=A0ABW1NA27_9ACTN